MRCVNVEACHELAEFSLVVVHQVQRVARNRLGPLGSDVTLGLEKFDGRIIDTNLYLVQQFPGLLVQLYSS